MNEQENEIVGNREGLSKYLSPIAIWALSFGCSVGWGAFVMPGTTFLPVSGPLAALIGMMLGSAVMLVIGMNYHYLMNVYPDAGGTFTYTKQIFGYDHGFLSAWFLCLAYISILWANMTALPLIARRVLGDVFQFGFHYQLAGFDIYFGEILLELAALILCELLCMFRKRIAVTVQAAMALVLILGIFFCFVAAMGQSGGISGMEPAFRPDREPFMQIFSMMMMMPWAFVGFESISHSTEEFHVPVKKSFWFIGVSIVTGFLAYALLNSVAAMIRPGGYDSWVSYIADLDHLDAINSTPVFFAMYHCMGKTGLFLLGTVVLAGILTGIIGNTVAASRLLFSMARDRILPGYFGRLDKDQNPRNAIFFIMAVSLVIPFLGRIAIGWIVDVATICATIIYGYTSAAAYRRASLKNERKVQATGIIGIVMSIIFGLFLMVPNLWSVSTLAAETYLLLALWCILGFVFFRLVFREDKDRRFGKNTAAWVALLFLIFFSSLMWMRQAVHTRTEKVLGDVGTFYVNEMQKNGLKRKEIEVQKETEFLENQMEKIRRSLLNSSMLLMVMILLSLVIMFNIYATMKDREEQMEVEKIKAEQNSKAKSIFLSNMSHDIRTPMNAIIGYINLAKREDMGLEDIQSYLDKIEGSSQHLLALINDVLEMSRIESGKMELEEMDVDLGKVMQEVHDMFATQMQEKKVNYTVEYEELTNRAVLCDKNRLNRVLLNLISNAYKFTPEEGSVDVRLRQLASGEEGRGLYELRVKDSGIGMTKEFAAKVFEAFERERTSTVSGIQGTGLGMAITKSIVDLMGGDISVKTAPGEGTEFIIQISFAFGNEDALERDELQEDDPESSLDFSKIRILLVDDIEINREIAESILTDMEFMVDMAENGQMAVDIIKNSKPGYYQVVLMDIQMPVMNGYDATRAIRSLENPSLAKIPIIAMTADAFQEDVQKSQEAGMDAHIAKPIDISILVKTLTEILEREDKKHG